MRSDSEERYHSLSEVAFEALVIHDRGVIVEANRSCATMFGYASAEEMIGKNALDMCAPESRALAAERIASGSDEPYDVIAVRKDGSTFIARARGRSVTLGGRLLRGSAILDVSEQRRTEEALRQVISCAPMVLFASDREGTVTVSEGKALEGIGLKPGQAIGVSVYSFVAPADVPGLRQDLRRVLAGESVVSHRQALGVFWETHWDPLRAPGGEIVGITGLSIDVTARHRAEADRERLYSELSAILENIAEAVLVVDTRGRFTRVNRAARALFGVSGPEELTEIRSSHAYQVLRLDGTRVELHDQALSRALRGEVVIGEELCQRMGDRERFVRVSAAPIRGADGAVTDAVAVVSDISAEVAFDRLKDRFLSLAAHELRTPVTVIKTAAQLALATTHEEELRGTLERIDRGATRIDAVVTHLLDVSQLQLGRLTMRLEPLDLSQLVAGAVARINHAMPGRIQVACAPDAQVLGDRLRLEQVLSALLRNALKYSPAGGEIDVRLDCDGGEAVVSVRDRGIGIPAAKQPHIFESFYSAHDATSHDYGGIGLGLHVAREFVHRHGGRIWFESEEGAGSTFRFALPLRRDGLP